MLGGFQHIDCHDGADIAIGIIEMKLERFAQVERGPVGRVSKITLDGVEIGQFDRAVDILLIASHQIDRRKADVHGDCPGLSCRVADARSKLAIGAVFIICHCVPSL